MSEVASMSAMGRMWRHNWRLNFAGSGCPSSQKNEQFWTAQSFLVSA